MDEVKSTRDIRQEECVKKWLQSGGRAAVVAATGFGKTSVAILAIKRVRTKYPNLSVLVIVPTKALKDQWIRVLQARGIDNVSVEVIHTAIKHNYEVDMLIIDEIHRSAAATLFNVFKAVHYKLILGLTGTFERLDNRDKLIEKYCPVCDRVTVYEAMSNGWVSNFTEYQVLIDVEDIDVYKQLQKEFIQHFEFFSFSFDIVMSLVGKDGFQKRKEYTSKICKDMNKWNDVFKQVTYHAIGFNKVMMARKKFINNHVRKIEIARQIIDARPNSKIITFSNNVQMAESIRKEDPVYTGRLTKKKGRMTLDEFAQQKAGVLHSCNALDEGLDCPGLEVAIILGLNSSKTKSTQRLKHYYKLKGPL